MKAYIKNVSVLSCFVLVYVYKKEIIIAVAFIDAHLKLNDLENLYFVLQEGHIISDSKISKDNTISLYVKCFLHNMHLIIIFHLAISKYDLTYIHYNTIS